MSDSSLENNKVCGILTSIAVAAAVAAYTNGNGDDKVDDKDDDKVDNKQSIKKIDTSQVDDQDKLIKLGTNMNKDHLLKELEVLKNRFPKLDEDYLLNILKEKKGHPGKATQAIFKAGGEGVQEAEEDFYKKYPGAFIDRLLRPGMLHMIYLWNINYDGSFVRDRPSKIVLDKDGKKTKLFQQDSFLWNNEDPNYKNLEYFDKLAFAGNNVHEDENWGTNPHEIYDENHSSNEKGVIMSIHELDVILHVWKIPLLGIHPYINDDGIRCNYIGKEVRNRIKKKLPEGWTRSASQDYNGLWSYLNKEKNIVQWEHPFE